ncbi:MAG: WYL domain-containing protein [Bacteroidales bacterium]|nr:WYL domain-containing protein [Bacteroidales bacterium]
MPAHKSKNFRFRIIDECLRDTSRLWSLDDLISEVSRKLTDEFNVEKVSRRSIQYDIALMREKQPVGYNAPIVCFDGKYSYSDKDFSIKNMQLSKPDIDNLTEVATTLKQYKQYTHLGDITKLIEKIEAIIAINPQPDSLIASFESTKKIAKGVSWLKQIVEAICQKHVIELSFKEKDDNVSHIVLHPYFLKEFNNEWYLYGLQDPSYKFIMVPVSEIAAISPQIITFIENEKYTPENYFKHLIGISPEESTKPVNVTLKVSADILPTLKKCPIHPSQTINDMGIDGALVDLKVIINKDLTETILKYGSNIKVEAPDKLRKAVLAELKAAYEAYFQLSLF